MKKHQPKQTLSEQTEHEIGVLFSEAAASIKYLLENAADETLSIDTETEVPAIIETLEEKITDLVGKLFGTHSIRRALQDLDTPEQDDVLAGFELSSEQMIQRLTGDGYTVLKVDSVQDKDMLEDFVRSAIYPYNVNHQAGEGLFV